MKSLLSLSFSLIFFALSGCNQPATSLTAKADPPAKAGIYASTQHDEGVMLKLALHDEKQIALFLGDEQLFTTWTRFGQDEPVEYYIAVHNGILFTGGARSEISTLEKAPGLRLDAVFDHGDQCVQEAVLGQTADGTPFRIVLEPLNEEIQATLAKEAISTAREES